MNLLQVELKSDLTLDYISHHSSKSVKILNKCSGVEVHNLLLNCSGEEDTLTENVLPQM